MHTAKLHNIFRPILISDSFRDVMVKREGSQLQDSEGNFPGDGSGRPLNKYWLEKKAANRREGV